MNQIDLAQLLLSKNVSKTEFLSDNKMRLLLNYQSVNISFSYRMEYFNIFPVNDEGYFVDTNLQLQLDLLISSNPNGITYFHISHFDFKPGHFEAHLKNKFLNFILKIFVYFSDFIVNVFKSFINYAVQGVINKLSNSIPT